MFAQYMFDAMQLYMKVVDKIVSSGGDYRDGPTVFKYSRGVNFTGTYVVTCAREIAH